MTTDTTTPTSLRLPPMDAIMVSLKVNGETVLFVLLAADGTANRMGTGSVYNQEWDMFIGLTNGEMFHQLRSRVDPTWFDRLGGYELPNRIGQECELMVGFRLAEGKETGLMFKYGSESQGPPGDVCDFVKAAVEITQPWLETQKAMVAKNAAAPAADPAPRQSESTRKPWWKFW